MRNLISFKKILLFSLLIILIVEESRATLKEFTCPTTKGDPMPFLPQAFSTDIRYNFQNQLYTIEAQHYVDGANHREALEIWTPKRHVKYILHEKYSYMLVFPDDGPIICSSKNSNKLEIEPEDAGPNNIMQKMYDVTDFENFILSHNENEIGIFMRKWEGCFNSPRINISAGFTESDWTYPRTSKKSTNAKHLVMIEAQIDNDFVVAVFDNFHPTVPDDAYFQPPENVYCEGFRSEKSPPSIPDYFIYDAEIIVFESSEGIAPMVSHRKVYYDFPSKIVRTEFHDPMTENQGNFSKITTQGVSIIHDFGSSVQYNIDPMTGKCSLEDYMITVDTYEVKETKDSEMPTGKEFFSLDARKISYNGQFMTRGYLTDVYTAKVSHLDGSPGKNIYTWYFSADQTEIVENDKVEKNVLLRMVIQPEEGAGYEGRVELNFYNFRKEEPNPLMFDLTTCYNEATSKTFVLTFPANDALRGTEKFIKLPVHLALKDTTGLSKQRIFVSEVFFNKKYMFAEFKLLDAPSALKSTAKGKEMSLTEAVNKLKTAVDEEKFKVAVVSDNRVVELKPEPNGFNEFAGDRRISNDSPYKEGSVIGLTIGMLLLGVVLGGITVNLIISRKYGVSLFQKSKSGMNRFGNDNESSI